MKKLLTCLAIVAAGTALLSCGAPEASAPSPSVAYEPRGSIERTPLAPPPGYGSGPMPITPQATGPDNGSSYAGSAPSGSGDLVWKASPRWAEVRGNDKLEGEQAN
jgi:hypothetical protein